MTDRTSNPFPTSSSPEAAESFSKTAFDYLVIGGGNCGSVIASRLSENPQIKVGLIEAGLLHFRDPIIEVPANITKSNGDSKYDWNFLTAPQPQANGRSIPVPRGKILGGSSALNFMAWDRASKQEYDAWKTLSDDGWDWEEILPNFLKSESAGSYPEDPYPSMSQSPRNVVNNGDTDPHGSSGPVKISYNAEYNDLISHVVKAWNTLGVSTNANPYGGNKTGVYNTMNTIDRESGTRSDAARSYLYPAADRKNLVVLTAARAIRIVFDENVDSCGNFVATSVLFDAGGTVFSATASKEVILSAGVIQTPQLLELSGIGNKTLLNTKNVKSLVNLPGVGENLQDHIFAPMQLLVKSGFRTFDELRINTGFASEQAALYNSTKKGWLTISDSTVVFIPSKSFADNASFSSKLQMLEESLKKDDLSPLQKAQYDIQIAWLKEGVVPDIEVCLFSKGFILTDPDRSFCVIMAGIQHPFSRGSVHIDSADPFAAPIIDPQYLSNKFDLEMLVDGYRLLETFVETDSMKNVIASRSVPPAPFGSDEELAGFIRAAFVSGSHHMGTCAMARRELGGVVDSRLKVYGTANVRVADASIIPMSMAAHTQATVFAIGEKAADLIKQGM